MDLFHWRLICTLIYFTEDILYMVLDLFHWRKFCTCIYFTEDYFVHGSISQKITLCIVLFHWRFLLRLCIWIYFTEVSFVCGYLIFIVVFLAKKHYSVELLYPSYLVLSYLGLLCTWISLPGDYFIPVPCWGSWLSCIRASCSRLKVWVLIFFSLRF